MTTTAEQRSGHQRSMRRVGALAGRALLRLVTFVGLGLLVVVAVLDATGRVRIVPAPDRTLGTAYQSTDLVAVVPVPAPRLHVGDVVIVKNEHEHALLRIEKIVDSQGPQVQFAGDPAGRTRKLGGTTWRVRKAIPYLGLPLRALAGPVQSLVLVALGLLLVIRAEVTRGRESAPPAPQTGRAAA